MAICSGSELPSAIRSAPGRYRKGEAMKALWVSLVVSVALLGCNDSGQPKPDANNGTQMMLFCLGLDLEGQQIPMRPRLIDMRQLLLDKERGWSSGVLRPLTGERWGLSCGVIRLGDQALRIRVSLDIHGGPRHEVTSSMSIQNGQTSVAFLPSGEHPRFAVIFAIVTQEAWEQARGKNGQVILIPGAQ
jgi:hypothetical protein